MRSRLRSFAFLCACIAVPSASAWGAEQVLHTFTNQAYGFPSSTLISDPAGNLYGVGAGSVFELSPSNGKWMFQILHAVPSGAFAEGRLLRDAGGNLYGGTWQGGSYDCGLIYRLSPNPKTPWNATVLHEFNRKDGAQASFGLAEDAAGNLYGVTEIGGANDDGVAYELSPNSKGTWTYTVLHNFSPAEGDGPQTSLIFDTAGNLYGGNGGGIFKLSPNGDGSWTESTVLELNGGALGSEPYGDLMFDSAGNLYATTNGGGAYSGGTALMLTPDLTGGWTVTVLHSFGQGTDGAVLFSGLAMDSSGNLYGTTSSGGGLYNNGTVYELSPSGDGWAEIILKRFGPFGNPQGAIPFGGLFLDSSGNLYGDTTKGGDEACYQQAGGCGVIFEIPH